LTTSLAVGSDGYNRTLLGAFGTRSARNSPSNSQGIFGPATWIRHLIKPRPGYGVAYIDWSQQEFAIAGALSGDGALQQAYQSGDPYLAFAKQSGLAPEHATKATHPLIRERCKTTVLGIQYGMGERSLAERLDRSPSEGRLLLRKHRETYPVFWKWISDASDYAFLGGQIHNVFGWTLHIMESTKPRTVQNFPMQSNGSAMLQLACIFATESGIEVCMPVHDALLVQGPLDRLDEHVATTQACMAKASEIVLSGFQLRSEARLIRYPNRFTEERGAKMWATVQSLLARFRAQAPVER
jgi:DNA polymerase I